MCSNFNVSQVVHFLCGLAITIPRKHAISFHCNQLKMVLESSQELGSLTPKKKKKKNNYSLILDPGVFFDLISSFSHLKYSFFHYTYLNTLQMLVNLDWFDLVDSHIQSTEVFAVIQICACNDRLVFSSYAGDSAVNSPRTLELEIQQPEQQLLQKSQPLKPQMTSKPARIKWFSRLSCFPRCCR